MEPSVTVQKIDTPKKTYQENKQVYTTEDGKQHTIYWAQGIEAPKMPESLKNMVVKASLKKVYRAAKTDIHICLIRHLIQQEKGITI